MRSIEEMKLDLQQFLSNKKDEAQAELFLEVSKKYDLVESIPLPELEPLCNAYREGRCVVLPCKDHDTIYYIDKCSKCNKLEVRKIEDIAIGGIMAFLDEFGKTAFLTEAEANNALKEASK